MAMTIQPSEHFIDGIAQAILWMLLIVQEQIKDTFKIWMSSDNWKQNN